MHSLSAACIRPGLPSKFWMKSIELGPASGHPVAQLGLRCRDQAGTHPLPCKIGQTQLSSPPARGSGAIWAPLASCRNRADRPWHSNIVSLAYVVRGLFTLEGGSQFVAYAIWIVRVRYIVPLLLRMDSSNIKTSRNFTTKPLTHNKYNTIICKYEQHEPAARERRSWRPAGGLC
jgi:hypothetical protein